jgi:hypothetical protein
MAMQSGAAAGAVGPWRIALGRLSQKPLVGLQRRPLGVTNPVVL